ncbi:MAG TPA: response regulator [Oculatellaceae cyanobacterium]|jgi:CheY-like chemotaxis protein
MPNTPRTHTILVVEDDITLRHVLILQLDKLGIRADSAANGIEALRRVHNFDYDLILMDIQMPDMNGLEAAVAIRSHEKQKQHAPIPIIAMTAGAPGVDSSTCLSLGFNDFVLKPLTLGTLKSLIQKWLGASNNNEEATNTA